MKEATPQHTIGPRRRAATRIAPPGHEGACSIKETALLVGGVSDATIYRKLRERTAEHPQHEGDECDCFPLPFKITEGRTAFLRAEILDWVRRRVAQHRRAAA